MKKEEGELLISKILEQQATINTLRDKIQYLHVLIDTLSRELEKARKGGML